MPTIQWLRAVLAAALIAGLVLLVGRLLPPVAAIENLIEHALIAYLSPVEPQHSDIVIVAVTEDTLGRFTYRAPVDRGFLSDLIERLVADQVRAIGLDILLDQPTEPLKDERLRTILRRAPMPIVAITASPTSSLTERQRAFLSDFLQGVATGDATLALDWPDGLVRWHHPHLEGGSLSFPAALARSVGATVPDAPFEIAWSPRPGAATTAFVVFPAEAVPLLPTDWLRGRIVLIGATLPEIDRHETPVAWSGERTSGVEIQAHILAQILGGRRAARASLPLQAAVAFAGALAGETVTTYLVPGLIQVAAGTGLVLALSLGLGALYALGGPLVPPLPPILAGAIGIGLALFELARREQRDRIVLMDLFSEHLSKPVAAAIWRQRAAFLTGGRPRPQRLTATVLFSDIDSFTPACEQLDPEPLMAWVQTYLNAMTGIIAEHGGIVLRFMGDGILAAFGVPVARDDDRAIAGDAVQSVRCALQMGAVLDELNRAWRDEGLPPVSIRIGIQTGPLVAGSLGNDRHMEYTIMGDTVNVASRLEAFARTESNAPGRLCRVLVGEETWRLLDGRFDGEPLGPLALKGKLQSVRSYRIMAERRANDGCALAAPVRGTAATPQGSGE